MSEMLNMDITPEQAGQLFALMEQCTQAIRDANERMDKDEAERKQLQAETRIMLDQLKEMLCVENNSQFPQ